MKSKKFLALTIALAVLLLAGGVYSITRFQADRNSIATLNSEVDRLNKDVTNKDGQLSQLSSELAEQATKIEALTADAAAKAGQIETLTADLEKKSGEYDALSAELSEKESEIEKLTGDLEKKGGEYDALSTELSGKRSEIEKLTADLEKKGGEYDALSTELSEKKSEIVKLTADLEQNTTKSKELTEKLEALKSEAETLRTDTQEKGQQLDSLKAELSGKEEEISALRDAVKAARSGQTDASAIPPEPIVPVLTGDHWIITQEYSYDSYSSYHAGIVIHHTMEKDQQIEVTFSYYNDKHTLIGVKSETIRAAAANVDYYMTARNDAPFDQVAYTVKLKEAKHVRSASGDLEISTSIVGEKAILTAKNTGKVGLRSTEFYALFLDEKGKLAAVEWGFLDEIEPGGSTMKESKPYDVGPFVEVKVYAQPDVWM